MNESAFFVNLIQIISYCPIRLHDSSISLEGMNQCLSFFLEIVTNEKKFLCVLLSVQCNHSCPIIPKLGKIYQRCWLEFGCGFHFSTHTTLVRIHTWVFLNIVHEIGTIRAQKWQLDYLKKIFLCVYFWKYPRKVTKRLKAGILDF